MKFVILIYFLPFFPFLSQGQLQQSFNFNKGASWVVGKSFDKIESDVDNRRDTSQVALIHSLGADSLLFYKWNSQEVIAKELLVLKKGKEEQYILNRVSDVGVKAFNITLDDGQRSIKIDDDVYFLSIPYYNTISKSLKKENNVAILLDLISDNLADYELAILDYSPLFLKLNTLRGSKLNRHIIQADLKTVRSQAPDLKDSWRAEYIFKKNQLKQIVVKNNEELRGDYKIAVIKNGKTIRHFTKNIEDRQITEGEIITSLADKCPMQWKYEVLETGKQRTTKIQGELKDLKFGHKEGLPDILNQLMIVYP